MLKNVVRICVFLALFSKVFCQSHLTQQDWDLASTINFRELAEHYQSGNTGCQVFKRGGTKLEIFMFLPKNQYTQRKLLNFKNWTNEKVSQSAQI